MLVKKFTSDETVGPSSDYVADEGYQPEGEAEYKPPAAVDSQIEPTISEVPSDSQQGAFTSDSAAVL